MALLAWAGSVEFGTRATRPVHERAFSARLEGCSWSADGTRLAVASSAGVWLWSPGTDQVRQLTSSPCGSVAWSPVNRHALALSDEHLVAMTVAGGLRASAGPGCLVLTEPGTWAPGRRVSWRRPDDVLPGDRVEPWDERVSNLVDWVSWSPDGLHLAIDAQAAFPSREPDQACETRSGVVIASRDLQTARFLCWGGLPAWAPRGDDIALLHQGGLEIRTLAGRLLRRVEFAGSTLAGPSLEWAPDGGTVAACLERRKADGERPHEGRVLLVSVAR